LTRSRIRGRAVEFLWPSWVFGMRRVRPALPNIIPTVAPTVGSGPSAPLGIRRVRWGARARAGPCARTRARVTRIPKTRMWCPGFGPGPRWRHRPRATRACRRAVTILSGSCDRTRRVRRWETPCWGPACPPRRIPDRERGRCPHDLEITFTVTCHRICQSHGSTTVRLFC